VKAKSPSQITLTSYSYEERIPDMLTKIADFLSLVDVALYGRFEATLEPVENVSQAELEIELTYVKAEDFLSWCEGLMISSGSEIRVFSMEKLKGKYVAEIRVEKWYPMGILDILASLFSRKSFIEKMASE